VASPKDELRRAARRLRDTIDPATGRQAADAAARHLLALPQLEGARRVAVYASVAKELDVGPASRALRARGLELVYPRVLPGAQRLEFHLVGDEGELLRGAFGIAEPRPEAAPVSVGSIDAFVVPGLAFDPNGGRVGWGRGYYDRTLAAAPDRLRIGYCYRSQILAEVPHEAGDLPMHILVTESGAVACPITPSAWPP
jgi:5-formyltetrahydrofolate cyclo-ligase